MFPITVTVTILNAQQFDALTDFIQDETRTTDKATVSGNNGASSTTRISPPSESEAAVQQPADVAPPTATSAADVAKLTHSEPAEVDFATLKEAFLALSVKDGGRAKCEGLLKSFALDKLSHATPDQYSRILAAIQKADA